MLRAVRSILTRYFLAVLAIGAAFAASISVGHAESTMETVTKRGKLTVGVRADYPPYGYIDASGNNVGFDLELAKYIAAKLGVAIELTPVTSTNRIPMLQAGTVDMLVASLSVTRQREEALDFTIPYIAVGGTFVVRKDSTISSYADLAGKTVAFLQGTPSLLAFPKNQPQGIALVLQDKPQAVQAVLQGKADAFVDDVGPASIFVKQHPQLKMSGVAFQQYPIAAGVRQDDSRFRDAVNFAILDFFEDGTWAKVYTEYFGQEPDGSFEIQPWGPKL